MNKYLLALLFLLVVVLAAVISYSLRPCDEIEATNFEECVEAGFPVMESYPRQCSDNLGNTFVEEIEDEIIDEIGENDGLDRNSDTEYYGSSTYYSCEADSDCITSGCNNEICMSIQEEEIASICVFPDEPLPSDLGYVCGCFNNQCQWYQ